MLQCLDTKALAGKALSALVPVVLLGCSSMPLGSSEALAQSDARAGESVQSNMDSQLMFELMIADLAANRGQLDIALQGYLQAAERTSDARVSERAAQLAMFGRQWGDAERMLKRWISLDPSNEQAPRLLVQSLLIQEKVDPAVALYEERLNASNNKRQVLREIQFDLQNNNNPALSVAVMQHFAEAYPQMVEAQSGLARAHIANGDREAGLDAIRAALALSPKDTDALLFQSRILAGTGKLDEGLASLSEALDINPDNTELRLGYAQLLVEGGRNDEVGEQLKRIYAESGNDAQTRLNVSILAREAKLTDQAISYFSDLLASGEYTDQANFNLGRLNDEQLNYAEAISFYDAVGGGELGFNSRLRAAELVALTGELEQGRSRLQALAASVESPEQQPRIISSESRMLQNDNQSAAAVDVLSEGLVAFPDNPSLLYARALTAVSAGDEDMMVADLERLISLEPENAHALNALGYHYADINKELERADQLLAQAIALMPNDPAIVDSLGWLRFRQGRYDEAVDLLRQAYALFPDPEIAGHLAQALLKAGASDEARALLANALDADPEDSRLLELEQELPK